MNPSPVNPSPRTPAENAVFFAEPEHVFQLWLALTEDTQIAVREYLEIQVEYLHRSRLLELLFLGLSERELEDLFREQPGVREFVLLRLDAHVSLGENSPWTCVWDLVQSAKDAFWDVPESER